MLTSTKSRTRSQKRSAPKDVDEGEPSKVTKSANILEFCKGERAECDNHNQQGTGAGDGGGGEEGGVGVGSRHELSSVCIKNGIAPVHLDANKERETEQTDTAPPRI